MTKKELIFIFVACSLAAGLLRTRDTVTVESVWRQSIDPRLYSNGRFPEEGEKLPPPIVTDLDSDGLAGQPVNIDHITMCDSLIFITNNSYPMSHSLVDVRL